MPAGRPSSYTPETAQIICDLIAHGKSLMQICALESMPSRETIYQWQKVHPEFADDYAKARIRQADYYFELINAVAFDDSRDVTGELKMPNSVAVSRDRLKIDSLKWILGRMDPAKYGDKVQAEHTGSVGLTLIHDVPRPKRDE